MNILILNWRDPKHPNSGGAEQVTLAHAKGWIEAGHTVIWFCSHYKNAKRQEMVDGITIIRSGHYAFGVQIAAFLWYIAGNHPRFDLVVDQIHGLPFFTPLYVRAKKLAFIHEVAREVWKLNPWPWPVNKIVSLLGITFEPLIFKLCYTKISFLTVSESTRNDLIQCGIPGKNITIINNGVDLREMPRKLPRKEKKITTIFLGAISLDKGIGDALLVFSEIKKKDPAWQFWIVGKASPDMEEFVESKIKELHLEECTTYFGFVSEKRKFKLLARAHVMINPSVHEGWGLVNIEANAVGTPVVAYNVHGSKDSIANGETGILVEKGNYKKMAEVTRELIENKKSYQIVQKHATQWSKQFVWVEVQKKSLELVENI